MLPTWSTRLSLGALLRVQPWNSSHLHPSKSPHHQSPEDTSTSNAPTSSCTPSTSLDATLTPRPEVTQCMRTQFSENYKHYTDKPWYLPSGSNVDEILYKHTLSLTVESSFHSFVVDAIKVIVVYLIMRTQNHFRMLSIQQTPRIIHWLFQIGNRRKKLAMPWSRNTSGHVGIRLEI